MKKLLLALSVILVLSLSGCNSVSCDGFSVGALYLNADVTTESHQTFGDDLGGFHSKSRTDIDEIVPVFMVNFKFK